MTNSWISLTPMLTARSGSNAVVHDGKIHVLGGWDPTNLNIANYEIFDPASNSWTVSTSMPNPHNDFALGKINGKLYAVGGGTNGNAVGPELDIYDIASDTWTAGAPIPVSATYTGAVHNGLLYAFVGDGPGGSDQIRGFFYDPGTNEWTEIVNSPTQHIRDEAVLFNNKIYLVGGFDTGGPGYSSALYEYTPDTFYYVHQSDGTSTGGGGLAGDFVSDTDGDTSVETEKTTDSDNIIFQTDGTLGMVITSDNRVGIGTDQTQGGTLTIQSQSTHTNILMNTTQPNQITGIDLYNGNAPKWAMHSRGTLDGANLDDRLSFQNGSASEVMTFRQTGSVGIGTNTPNYHLDIRHPTGQTLARIDTVAGSNLSALFLSTGGNDDWHFSARGSGDSPTGRLAIYDQSNYEAMTFLQGGNVGIGTNNPAEQLHIKNASGNSQVSIEGGAGAFASTLEFKNNGASKWLLQSRGTIDGPNDRFTIHNAGAASQVFTILQTGAVGIGTSTPSEKFHVNGNSLTTGYSMFGDSLFFADTSIHADPILAFDAADYIQFDRATDKFFFNINNTERFSILNNGNVGVGKTSPTTALHVGGGGIFEEGLSVGHNSPPLTGKISVGDTQFYLDTLNLSNPAINWDANDYHLFDRGSDTWVWVSGGSEKMRLDSQGRMGINTTNNYAKMVIDKESEAISTLALVAQPGIWNNLEFRHGGVSQWHLSSRNTLDTPNDRFGIFNTSSSELFTILQTGAVGIGTNSPSEKLEVAGSVKTDSVVFSDNTSMGEFVAFYAKMSANQAIGAASATKLAFDAVRYNYGNQFSTVNEEFVAPVKGIYNINAQAKWISVVDGAQTVVYIYINGSEYSRNNVTMSGTAVQTSLLSMDVYAEANDVIEIYVYTSAAMSVSSEQNITFFQGRLVRKL